ncbi:TPA: hypothetical protein ACH3X3_001172 [Trebouxia sp. C0006]
MHKKRKAASKLQLPFYDRPVRRDTSPVQSTGQRHSNKRQGLLSTMLSSLSMETSSSKRQKSSASSVWSKTYPKPPGQTSNIDDDEYWKNIPRNFVRSTQNHAPGCIFCHGRRKATCVA